MNWPLVNIDINGEKHTGIAPYIISASRATDIPAFFGREFFENLKKGYTYWANPFNGKKSLISFINTRFVVFWTKNAAPIMTRFEVLDEMGINYYFNYTLNNYDKESLEPGLPSLTSRIETFIRLSEKVGRERIIWRFDPLVLLKGQEEDILIHKIISIAEKIHKHTTKLVVSFVDTSYKRVQNNLKRKEIEFQDFDKFKKVGFLQKLHQNLNQYGLEIYTCAEKEDLNTIYAKENKCIDADLIEKLSPNNSELISFIEGLKKLNRLKDKGQRPSCGCMVSKDIGHYNTCYFSCVYCYAGNRSTFYKK